MGYLALGAFWAGTAYLWVVDGPKIPLFFIAFWVAGLVAVVRFGLNPNFFVAFEAMSAAILLIIGQYKSRI